ncbi:unnamed protein product [Pleuronectes platessa]|uniref:Uncharacterized protein n=1 Tax=Pleuronectes platessa TaxID=8262 RepID=A0A9N7VBY4_PLEPL|nr:unnamed protein product [Pleuronectes platessa]
MVTGNGGDARALSGDKSLPPLLSQTPLMSISFPARPRGLMDATNLSRPNYCSPSGTPVVHGVFVEGTFWRHSSEIWSHFLERSQQSYQMMNSQAIHTRVGPAFQSKMPLFDGTTAATVLSKPQHMPGFLDKQALQYSGAYLTYDPRGKDGAGFPPPWSSSKTSLLDGRSPMSHLSGMEGQNHIFYRQDSSSPEERHSHSSSLCHSPVRQGFTLYTKSPEMGSPTAAVRKPRSGGENSSPPSENSVYLAIPKPVYRHTPCCNELGCVIGHRYSVEHGSPRIPNPVYKHDWMQSDAHYAERPAVQRKTQEVLLQQRGLQFDPSAEQLKRISVETYSPSAGRTLPAGIDPNYSGYPCTPTRTLFGSLSEQSQRLQSSPRGYPSQYPSHPPYEHMTSEVYQERSPMSKYGQITHHPVFYYPHANEEVQNSPRCKNAGSKQRDVPVILKHTSSIPREHYIVPQSLNGEIPLPSTETLPSHSFMQGFDYPCYAVPRFNVNTSHIRVPQKRPHASPSFHSNLSPTRQHMNHPLTSAANPHKDSPNSSLHGAQSQIHSPYRGVDLTSPTRCRSQLGLSLPMINLNRPFPSLASWHMDPHLLSPGGLKRLMDYSSCEAQATQHPVSTPPWLPQSPSHSADRIQASVTNSANVRQIIYSPANAAGSKDNAPTSTSGSSVPKGCLKRHISHPSPPVRIKEEARDLCEAGLMKKRQRVEMENGQAGNKTPSPPMPVIDTVFSLAPYQAYLHVSKVLFPGRSVQSSEPKPDVKAKKSDGDEQRPVVCPVPPKICPDTPERRKAVVETFEQKDIKVEQVDPSYTEECPVGQKDCFKVTIKQEPEEAGSSPDCGHMLVIKKCEPDEPKIEASVADEDETSDESKTVELSRPTSSYSDGDASELKEQVSTLQSKSTPPPQPPESKLNFKNIPPQCLKLSSYRIILPDMKHSSPAPPPPPEKPETEMIPKQVPVRKRFFELHNSLCKLISKSVSASAEQDLRTWLTQLPLTEPAATFTKVQKVSCLLGARAREVWLNEEMKSALHEVLERLKEYTTQELCPFPHVMRTGAVFLPMLVMKELLFPMVQVSFIDQVLHEHKVALRPTTLSEEKILIQLHKRACSSRLRRLMSLKHLPDIYADVVNLLYYACVCKHLESTSPDVQKRVQD